MPEPMVIGLGVVGIIILLLCIVATILAIFFGVKYSKTQKEMDELQTTTKKSLTTVEANLAKCNAKECPKDLSAELATCNASLATCPKDLSAELAVCNAKECSKDLSAELETCNASLAACPKDLSAELAACNAKECPKDLSAELATCNASLAACPKDLSAEVATLKQQVKDLTEYKNSHPTCPADRTAELNAKIAELATCNTALANNKCPVDKTAELNAKIAELAACNTAKASLDAKYIACDGELRTCKTPSVASTQTAITAVAATESLIPLTAANVTQSGFWENNPNQYPIANLVDGNPNTTAHTGAKDKDWIKITIANDIPITKIVITNRVDYGWDRIVGATLTILNSANTPVFTYTFTSKLAEYTITPPVNTVGKVILLQRPNSGIPLNIGEMKVYGKIPVNNTIASMLGFTTATESLIPLTATNITQSSTIGFPISNLVDDKPTTFAHTGSGDKEWIKATLTTDTLISKIVVTNRTDCCQDRIIGATLTILNNANASVFTYTFTSALAEYIITPPANTVGKVILLQRPNSGISLNIGEMKVYTYK